MKSDNLGKNKDLIKAYETMKKAMVARNLARTKPTKDTKRTALLYMSSEKHVGGLPPSGSCIVSSLSSRRIIGSWWYVRRPINAMGDREIRNTATLDHVRQVRVGDSFQTTC